MSFKLSNTYLKLFIMTAAASAMLVGSECLHRLYFDIVPLGRPWEEFLYLLTFTSILCFSRWAFTKVCAAFFLFLCLIVNPVHFEVYQSWINGINYYLALAEWSEVANTGERQKFCVHGIIGARQTGASNEHEHQTQFSQEVHQPPR